jgi:hypothetical protein
MIPANKCIEHYNKLKAARANFENVWQAIADDMIPLKNNIQRQGSPGEAKMNQIYDSTAMISLEYLAGALHGMLTSPTSTFFGLSTGDFSLDQEDVVRLWIQDTIRKMHDVLNQSNFQSEVHEYYIDLCGFGNGPLYMEEDDKDIVRFTSWPIGEVVVDENAKGKIDCAYHMFKMDARNIVGEFGASESLRAALPEKIKSAAEQNKTDEFEILHAIYPKDMAGPKVEPSGPYKVNFPFISEYIFVPDKTELEVKGFREFPLIFGRWSKVSGETYGRGPGEKALPESRVLQEMTKITLRGAQKVVDPPLQSPDDGFIFPLVTTPGGLNYYRAGSQDRIEPIFADARIDFGFQVLDAKRAQVREAFYVNQLQLREGPQMTATEVSQRVEQALRFLAPMLGRQQSEFLGPMVERLYGIMQRKQMLKPVPAILNNRPLKIIYSSVMAMAQRASEMQNINRTFSGIAPLVNMNPAVLQNINVDRSAKYIAKLNNFPQEMLSTDEELKAQRDAQAKAQAAAQNAAQNESTAKTLSDTMTAVSKQPKAG